MSAADRRWEELKARNLRLDLPIVKPAYRPRELPVQLPCDLGLFGDDADQLDLVEMCQQPTEDE